MRLQSIIAADPSPLPPLLPPLPPPNIKSPVIGHPRQAGSEGYFKKLSKGVFFWDYRHPLGPK